MTPSRRACLVLLPLVLLAASASSARGGDPASAPTGNRLRNGDFAAWRDGVPSDWALELGAVRGEGPLSRVVPGEGGAGLVLEGDADVRRWSLVVQRVDVRPGATYRLSFELRGVGLRRDPGQNDNAYVGARLFGPPERSAVPLRHVGPAGASFVPEEIVFRAEGERVDVVAFLSKTGRLELRRVVLEELRAEQSLEVLERHVARYYAHFDPAIPEWGALVAEHRAAFPADGGGAAFVEAARRLLAPLRDPHVWIRPAPGATLVVTHPPEVKANGDLAVVGAALAGGRRIGRAAIVGELGDDVGYLGLLSLEGGDAEYAEVARTLDGWQAARRRVLVDLRWNGGGDERRGRVIAARFADRERVYSRRRVRAGVGPLELSEPIEARLAPAANADPTTPVVVLIGPGCVSSGEGLAMMFHSLPHVRLVGKPTRGASGNPAPVELPNGVDVWFSRWLAYLADGTPLERRGVPPHVDVDPARLGDPTFSKGLEVLRSLPPAPQK